MDARTSRYHEVYAHWQRDPQGFWAEAAEEIDWFEKPKAVFDAAAGIYGRWFPGGLCNTCFNAVDRHVMAGRGEQAAIIYDSPLAGVKRTITYHRLMTETQVLAAMLRDLGVGKGDRVILRWCRRRRSACSPARASAQFTRSCSAVLPPVSLRPGSTTPSRR